MADALRPCEGEASAVELLAQRRNYLTLFTDLLARMVIFAMPGKDASVLESFVGIRCGITDMPSPSETWPSI